MKRDDVDRFEGFHISLCGRLDWCILEVTYVAYIVAAGEVINQTIQISSKLC